MRTYVKGGAVDVLWILMGSDSDTLFNTKEKVSVEPPSVPL